MEGGQLLWKAWYQWQAVHDACAAYHACADGSWKLGALMEKIVDVVVVGVEQKRVWNLVDVGNPDRFQTAVWR